MNEKQLTTIENTLRKLDLNGLTRRQKRFCLCFTGDPVRAAREAGYRNKNSSALKRTAWRLLSIPQIKDNIRLIEGTMDGSMVAKAGEILEFWTDIKRDEELDVRDRMTASKLLAQFRGLLESRLIVEKNTNVHVESNQPIVFANIGPGVLGRELGLVPDEAGRAVIDITPKKDRLEDFL